MKRLLLTVLIILGLLFQAGDSLSLISSQGPSRAVTVLFSSSTLKGNTADTNEDTLQTYTMPANVFITNGQVIRIKVTVETGINLDTKTVKIYFGSAVMLSIPLTTNDGGPVEFSATIYRTGASSQYSVAFEVNEVGTFNGNVATPNQTDTSPIVIKTTGKSSTATADNITNVTMTVELLNP